MRELLQKFKVMAGLSSDDPPDSKWISLEKTDKKTGKKVTVRRRVLFFSLGVHTCRRGNGLLVLSSEFGVDGLHSSAAAAITCPLL